MPELREWCEKYQIHLIECDLRWGVPKNTDTEETIQICLDELTRCIAETDGRPFFLNLLGERYGWIPNKDMLSAQLVSIYDWIYPISITHMEALHAALRTKSENALFLLREKCSLENLPENFSHLFIDSSLLAQKSLERFKRELSVRYPTQVFEYASKVRGLETTSGSEKVAFDNLDSFAEIVTNFFKTKLTNYAESTKNADEGDYENDKLKLIQDAFIEKRGRHLIGREQEIESMMNFVSNLEDKERCLFVIAKPGTGKSSLVANYVLNLNQGNIPCLYNFSSSAPGSTNSVDVLNRFCKQLQKLAKENNITFEDDPENEMLKETDSEKIDYDKLFVKFQKLLEKVACKFSGCTVVLDAVNQFSDTFGRTCKWLPVPSIELNIRYIISCTPEFGSDYSLLTNKFHAHSKKIYLSGFDVNSRRQLVKMLFSTYNKRVDDEQMELLTHLEAASSPLWLALVCEELRVFGVFEQVTEKIHSLPGSIGELISLIIKRIISEDETDKVKDAFCLLQCSNHGLTETELRYLLSDDIKTELPMMSWLRVRRKMKIFLLNTGLKGDEDMFTFFHASVGEAVAKDLLAEKPVKTEYHRRLAECFLLHGKLEFRVTSELLEQLVEAGMVMELIKFLRTDMRSVSIPDTQRSIKVKKFRCRQIIMPGNNAFKFPVYICNMCSNRNKILSSKSFPSKQMCVVCGAYVAFKKNPAFLCQRHHQVTAPKTEKCFHCKKIIFLEQKFQSYETCYCCMLCSSPNRCIAVPC